MTSLLTFLFAATFFSTACFSIDHNIIEISKQVQKHPLTNLKDYNVDDSFHSNPAYKMVAPVIPLIVETASQEELKNLSTVHGRDVGSISEWYLTPPHSPSITYMDFNNLQTFPSKAELDSFFSLNGSPFVNCSLGSIIEFNISNDFYSSSDFYINLKRFIDCALEKGKPLIFSAGNANQRSTHLIGSQIRLTNTQRKQILFVGALSPTANNSQKPSLYSGIPGKNEGEFLWAMGKGLIGQRDKEGTSYAAPRVTGLLCRLMGIYPQLTPEETIEIVCLTANKSPFISTNNPEMDEFLYGRHGAIDPMAALYFAANFLKLRTEGQTPNSFFHSQQLNKPSFQPAKTLRQKIDLMNFLARYHADEESDLEELRVLEVLHSFAKEINLDDLYAQPHKFFTPDDLYALQNFCTPQDFQFESFIKKAFPASLRDGSGLTPLHHSAYWGHLNLVQHYVKDAPHLINEQDDEYGFTPIFAATKSNNFNLDVISFLLDYGANPYIKDSITSMNTLEWTIAAMLSQQTKGNSKEQLKKAAVILIQHKTFDPQQLLFGKPIEEWAQENHLEQLYPEIYHALIKAMAMKSPTGAQ